jgi:hypothetical protein
MDLPTRFAVTFDYLCPFARNAHEHILAALESGAPWEVDFVPFSLMQNHTEPEQPDVYDDLSAKGILALQTALVVRDRYPDQFWAVHRALFAARHDLSADLSERSVVGQVLGDHGVVAEEVFAEIASGWPAKELEPTFIVDDAAVFARVMTRPDATTDSTATINRILDLVVQSPWLNEFKHTKIAR